MSFSFYILFSQLKSLSISILFKCEVTNKSVDVVVETHYDPREDLDLIHGEDTSCESKPDYARKRLTSFASNKVGGTLDKQKNVRLISIQRDLNYNCLWLRLQLLLN